MQSRIVAHRLAIKQALTKAHFHAEQLARLTVSPTDGVSDLADIPIEDRLPFEIQCLRDEIDKGLPTTIDGEAAYHQAKSAFSQFDWFSVNRPDSLTRRGDVLIVRRALSNGNSRRSVISQWQELIENLFDGQVIIHNASVDPKDILRVHFSLVCDATQ